MSNLEKRKEEIRKSIMEDVAFNAAVAAEIVAVEELGEVVYECKLDGYNKDKIRKSNFEAVQELYRKGTLPKEIRENFEDSDEKRYLIEFVFDNEEGIIARYRQRKADDGFPVQLICSSRNGKITKRGYFIDGTCNHAPVTTSLGLCVVELNNDFVKYVNHEEINSEEEMFRFNVPVIRAQWDTVFLMSKKK